MANPVVVLKLDKPPSSSTSQASSVQEPSAPSRISRPQPSSTQSSYLSTVRKQLQELGFTARSVDVIIASWREGTTSQYQTYLQKWLEFCQQKHFDILSPPLPMALDFLSMLNERAPHIAP